jgi:hypothetical protein
MGGIILPTAPWVVIPAQYGLEHPQEPLTFQGAFHFSSSQPTSTIDLTSDIRIRDQKFSLRTMWIDNTGLAPGSGTPVNASFLIGNTGQIIVSKANTQGFYPIVAADIESGAYLKVTGSAPTAGATSITVPVYFLNFDVPPYVGNPLGGGLGGNIANVQEGANITAAVSSFNTTGLGFSNFTNGNTVLVLNQTLTAAVSITSITGTGTSGWAQIATFSGSGFVMELWLGFVGPGAGGSVTVNLSALSANNYVVTEWRGMTASPVDGPMVVNPNQTTANPTTGSFNSATAGEMIYLVMRENSTANPNALPSGYTQINDSTGNTVATRSVYLANSGAPGPQGGTWGFALSHNFYVGTIGFKSV